MKHHLNTLFVTTQGAYLTKDGQSIAVKIEKKIKLRLPLLNLDGVVCFGRVGASPSLMAACAEAGVSISFLSNYGRLQARVLGFTSGNVLLRREQYRLSDSPDACLGIAKSMIVGKIANCRTTMMRSARDSNESDRSEKLRNACVALKDRLSLAQRSTNLDQLRGVEGEAASIYFDSFNAMLAGDPNLKLNGRSRRPPQDPVNSMLSFMYVILSHDIRSACESVGLDSQVGFLHRDRPGRPSLALDLMEEFRAVLVDRFVITLINRKQVSSSDFELQPSGGYTIKDSARRMMLKSWQERKKETMTHEFMNETVSLGLFVHLQARLLARHIRGDLDAYPPCFWK
jgi:CRISPR-associated protein Cas1